MSKKAKQKREHSVSDGSQAKTKRVRRVVEKVLGDLRQTAQPRPFRIAAPLHTMPQSGAGGIPAMQHDAAPVDVNLLKIVNELATSIWRVHKRLTSTRVTDDAARVTGALRLVENSIETARAIGLDIRDPLGQRYRAGLAVHILAFEKSLSCTVETIIDVVRPSVVLGTELIQRADVVVGTPVSHSSEQPPATPVLPPNPSPTSDDENSPEN